MTTEKIILGALIALVFVAGAVAEKFPASVWEINSTTECVDARGNQLWLYSIDGDGEPSLLNGCVCAATIKFPMPEDEFKQRQLDAVNLIKRYGLKYFCSDHIIEDCGG